MCKLKKQYKQELFRPLIIGNMMVISFLFINCKTPSSESKNEEVIVIEKAEKTETKKLLRHVVLFKFKESASKEDIDKVVNAFNDLPNKIEQIIDFEWGINNSPEGKDNGFTHSFIITFENEAGRDIYLPHPDHKAFGKIVRPILDDVFVIDYWTN